MSLSRILNDTQPSPPPPASTSNNSLSRLLNDDPIPGPSKPTQSRIIYSPHPPVPSLTTPAYNNNHSVNTVNAWTSPREYGIPNLPPSPPFHRDPSPVPSLSNGKLKQVPPSNENGPTTRSRKKRKTNDIEMPKRVGCPFIALCSYLTRL